MKRTRSNWTTRATEFSSVRAIISLFVSFALFHTGPFVYDCRISPFALYCNEASLIPSLQSSHVHVQEKCQGEAKFLHRQ